MSVKYNIDFYSAINQFHNKKYNLKENIKDHLGNVTGHKISENTVTTIRITETSSEKDIIRVWQAVKNHFEKEIFPKVYEEIRRDCQAELRTKLRREPKDGELATLYTQRISSPNFEERDPKYRLVYENFKAASDAFVVFKDDSDLAEYKRGYKSKFDCEFCVNIKNKRPGETTGRPFTDLGKIVRKPGHFFNFCSKDCCNEYYKRLGEFFVAPKCPQCGRDRSSSFKFNSSEEPVCSWRCLEARLKTKRKTFTKCSNCEAIRIMELISGATTETWIRGWVKRKGLWFHEINCYLTKKLKEINEKIEALPGWNSLDISIQRNFVVDEVNLVVIPPKGTTLDDRWDFEDWQVDGIIRKAKALITVSHSTGTGFGTGKSASGGGSPSGSSSLPRKKCLHCRIDLTPGNSIKFNVGLSMVGGTSEFCSEDCLANYLTAKRIRFSRCVDCKKVQKSVTEKYWEHLIDEARNKQMRCDNCYDGWLQAKRKDFINNKLKMIADWWRALSDGERNDFVNRVNNANFEKFQSIFDEVEKRINLKKSSSSVEQKEKDKAKLEIEEKMNENPVIYISELQAENQNFRVKIQNASGKIAIDQIQAEVFKDIDIKRAKKILAIARREVVEEIEDMLRFDPLIEASELSDSNWKTTINAFSKVEFIERFKNETLNEITEIRKNKRIDIDLSQLISEAENAAGRNDWFEVSKLLENIKTYQNSVVYKTKVDAVNRLSEAISENNFWLYKEGVINALAFLLGEDPSIAVDELSDVNHSFPKLIRDANDGNEVKRIESNVQKEIRKIKIKKNVNILVQEAKLATNDQEKEQVRLRIKNLQNEVSEDEWKEVKSNFSVVPWLNISGESSNGNNNSLKPEQILLIIGFGAVVVLGLFFLWKKFKEKNIK